jgi:hypothetical protein
MSLITDIGGAKVAKEGAEQGGALAQLTHEFNAQLDEANADFTAATTQQQVAGARRQGTKELSAQRAAIGASGLTSESFDAVSQESAMEVERDILAIELMGAVNEFNLRQGAEIERAAGEAAKFGASVQVSAIKRQAVSSTVSNVTDIVSFF